LDGHASPGHAPPAQRYPPVFRRFLLRRLAERVGESGLATARREVATQARALGAAGPAPEGVVEGGPRSPTGGMVDREVRAMRDPKRLDRARNLARLLPTEALADHPHLHELAGWPPPSETAVAAEVPRRRWLGRPIVAASLAMLILLVTWWLPPPE